MHRPESKFDYIARLLHSIDQKATKRRPADSEEKLQQCDRQESDEEQLLRTVKSCGRNFDSHLRRFEGGTWHRIEVPNYTENVVPYLEAHGLPRDEAIAQASRRYTQKWTRVYCKKTKEVQLGDFKCLTDQGRRESVYTIDKDGWIESCPAGSVLFSYNMKKKKFGVRYLKRSLKWERKSCGDDLYESGRCTHTTATISPGGGSELTERSLKLIPEISDEEIMIVKRTFTSLFGVHVGCVEIFARSRMSSEDGFALLSPLQRLSLSTDEVHVRTILKCRLDKSDEDVKTKIKRLKTDTGVIHVDGHVEGCVCSRGLLAIVSAIFGDIECTRRAFGRSDILSYRGSTDIGTILSMDSNCLCERLGLEDIDKNNDISKIFQTVKDQIHQLLNLI